MTHKEYLELNKEYANLKYEKNRTEQEDIRFQEVEKLIKDYNRNLCEEYPFLYPHNSWTDEIDEDYDYQYSELDAMPDGWRVAFADDFLKELKEELVKFNFIDDYRVAQVKEKVGELRWYDNGSPIGELSDVDKTIELDEYKWPEGDRDKDYWSYKGKNEEGKYVWEHQTILDRCKIYDIISKYVLLSRKTCINCGKPAKWESRGWISPYCDDCANKSMESYQKQYEEKLDINDFFRPVE